MIYLEPQHLKIISAILAKYPYRFYAFGSRVKGTHSSFSDLDLCFKDSIPRKELSQIKMQFEESNLPFKVDLIDWNKMEPAFQKLIENDLVAF